MAKKKSAFDRVPQRATGIDQLNVQALTLLQQAQFQAGVDLLRQSLAQNARTSVEMIERFYSSNLSAEMNIGMLHSRRAKQ